MQRCFAGVVAALPLHLCAADSAAQPRLGSRCSALRALRYADKRPRRASRFQGLDVGKEKKLTMVLDQKAVLYYAPENDLTDLAVRIYDKTHK